MFHALKMATNYRGTSSQLAGCLFDDVDTDQAFGKFFDSKTTLLSNDCSRVNMLAAIEQVVARCQPGDRYGIFWSGHGTFTKDQNGDEADGRDEAIVANDLKLIFDDEIFLRLAKAKPGVLGFLWTDCCHADGMVRSFGPEPERPRFMPFDFLTDGMLPCEITNICESGKKARNEFLSMRAESLNDVVHFAACQATEVSYDARFDGRPNGAFTYHALRAYSALPLGATFSDWMAAITPGRLPSGNYNQRPVARGAIKQVVFGRGIQPPPSVPPAAAAGPGVDVIVGGYRAKTWERIG